MRLLCENPGCRTHGRHTPECVGDPCKGCLPRPAADSLRLCWVCTRRLAEDAHTAAQLHHEISLQLRPSSRHNSEPVTGSGAPAGINPHAVETRRLIRHILISWMKLICDTRGFTPPPGHMPAIGAFIARNSEWLAAQTYAGDASSELHDLARGLPWRVAYPGSTRITALRDKRCPRCGGQLRALVRSDAQLLPADVSCDQDVEHRWDSTQWRLLDREIATKETAAATGTGQSIVGYGSAGSVASIHTKGLHVGDAGR